MKKKMEKKHISHISAVSFQRTAGSSWEYGLLFNEGDFGVIDMQGKEVPEVWNYEKHFSLLSITLPEVMTKESDHGAGE